MNTIVAESLDYCATKLEKATGGEQAKLNAAVQNAARRRSSPSTARSSSTATATPTPGTRKPRSAACRTCKTIGRRAAGAARSRRRSQLFEKYNVLSPRELESRFEIYLEQYCKTVNVEAKLDARRWPRR